MGRAAALRLQLGSKIQTAPQSSSLPGLPLPDTSLRTTSSPPPPPPRPPPRPQPPPPPRPPPTQPLMKGWLGVR